MENAIEYRGYMGQFSYQNGDENFHGTVMGLNDVIHFQGASIAELKQSLQDAVDDYLRWAAEEGRPPEKPYTGRFVVRLSPELHRRISSSARRAGQSLNQWVSEALQNQLNSSATAARPTWNADLSQSAPRLHEAESPYETGE